VLELWDETDAFAKLRDKNRGGKPWSFLDGPITANNPMGVHHAWGRSYKDMFQRYHAMNGRELRYQNGFDCQGLWVEVEVEKELGFKDKHDIVRYGLDEFVRRCKERVLKFAARQTAQSIRLGMWMEWDDPATLLSLRDALEKKEKTVTVKAASGKTVSGDPEDIVGRLGSPELGGSYFTFSTENNYTIWTFLKKCHDEGFIYRGADVMPWCFRCGTGLSQMEVAEGRAITKHTAVFVRFPLIDREKEALLVWTTTPWTLTSNVAAAVNVEMTYLKVRHGEWTYYVGKGNFDRARVQNLEAGGHAETHTLHTVKTLLKGSGELEVLGEIKGAELVGLRYTGPFDHLEAEQKKGGVNPFERDSSKPSAVECHRVIPWSEVSEAEGTGIVHIAPGCGAEDQRLGREHDLVAVAPLDESGRYVEGFGPLTGKHVMEVTDFIVSDLRERGLLVAKESYPHVYPHCWRCKQELVFRLVDEWFIRMDWRDRIQALVPQIRWIPPDGEAREQDWLRNMGDWMISKKRFWGLALPIWTCKSCDWFTVIGSREELEERAVEGWSTFDGHTPHRPWIDAVKVKCEGCGATASRIEDVGNPWLDAGIVPYSTVHYNTDRAYWQKWFPADFVVESFPGQFRNWFYSLLAMSAMMSRRPPFKVLLGHALVRDARGEEMHKSKGNAIAFDEAAEVLGAEVMRYLYAAQNPVQNLNFPDLAKTASAGKSSIDGEIRSKLLTFWNCYSFFVTYANADGWTPSRPRMAVAERSELDRWILSRLHRLIADAHAAFDDYALYRLIERLERFHDDLSNWYLRRSRRRFWKGEADADKESAYQTLYEVLTTEVRLLAPILPFLAEHMYQNLVRSVDARAPVSVHLTEYPVANAAAIDEALEAEVDCVVRVKNLALKLRNDAKVRARQPLSKLVVRPRNDRDRAVLSDAHFAAQILEEVNIKAIELIADESGLVSSTVKPNFKALGPKYGKHMKAIAAHVAKAEAGAIRAALDKDGAYRFELEGDAIELTPSDVEVALVAPENLTVGIDFGTFAALDTTLSPALEREGIARDFNRAAQDRRKALDLQVSDRIRVRYSGSDTVKRAIEENRDFLTEELLADSIEHVPNASDATAKVAGEEVGLTIERA
jgi:isoleucyl-tRNA synthetase